MYKEIKMIGVEISYSRHSRNMDISLRKKASIDFGVETTFAQIDSFLDDFKRILRSYKYCAQNQLYCKVYLHTAIYDRREEGLASRAFDGWMFEGIPDDADGLYLSPDLKYTEEHRDIYIDLSEPVLYQLAEYI